MATCLDAIRHDLVTDQPAVLRLSRARVLAGIELAIAKAWRRIAALERADEPDEGAIYSYLGTILRAHGQLARVAGILATPDEQIQRRVINRDLHQVVVEVDPLEAAKVAQDQLLAELMAPVGTVLPSIAAPAKRRNSSNGTGKGRASGAGGPG